MAFHVCGYSDRLLPAVFFLSNMLLLFMQSQKINFRFGVFASEEEKKTTRRNWKEIKK
jgi:hypothetical protein